MPRGYLKHSKEVSKKQARGGSSKICGNQRGNGRCTQQICGAVEDFALEIQGPANHRKVIGVSSKCNSAAKKITTHPVGECVICFKEIPLVCLSSKCKWHDAACGQCLHRIYVTNAQKSTKGYPLSCFHPLCDQPVHAAQLKKYNLFASPAEIKKHYEMLILAKNQKEKANGVRTVLCPKCDTPRGIRKFDKDRVYGCDHCKCAYQVSPDYVTIRAMENMNEDDFGVNDGWAKCPNCSILICKGDGEDDMLCVYCDHDFSWEEAKSKTHAIPFACPPDREIYLWW